MGSPKPLLSLRGTTFLRGIVNLHRALGLAVYVVLGEHRERIQAEVDLSDTTVLINPTPELGQLSSLQLATRHLGASAGLLVHPVDHPVVSLSTLQMLLRNALAFPGRLVFPVHQGRKGHPLVFPQALFPEILSAPLDQGARAVVRRHPELLLPVDVEDPGVLLNIDTPEEYRRLSEA